MILQFTSAPFSALFTAMEKGLDDCGGGLEDGSEEEEETQHKLDLMDTLGMAIAHLTRLSPVRELEPVVEVLPADRIDMLQRGLKQVRKRLSPEKLDAFNEVVVRLRAESSRSLRPLIHLFEEDEEHL